MFEITVSTKQAARLFLKSTVLSSYYMSLKVHLTTNFFFDGINYFIIYSISSKNVFFWFGKKPWIIGALLNRNINCKKTPFCFHDRVIRGMGLHVVALWRLIKNSLSASSVLRSFSWCVSKLFGKMPTVFVAGVVVTRGTNRKAYRSKSLKV